MECSPPSPDLCWVLTRGMRGWGQAAPLLLCSGGWPGAGHSPPPFPPLRSRSVPQSSGLARRLCLICISGFSSNCPHCCPVVTQAVSCQDQLIWQVSRAPSTVMGPHSHLALHPSCRVSRAGSKPASALACCVPLGTLVSSSVMAITATWGSAALSQYPDTGAPSTMWSIRRGDGPGEGKEALQDVNRAGTGQPST